MSAFYTEADYEKSVIALFQEMGYTYVYGPDIERDLHSPLYDDTLIGVFPMMLFAKLK